MREIWASLAFLHIRDRTEDFVPRTFRPNAAPALRISTSDFSPTPTRRIFSTESELRENIGISMTSPALMVGAELFLRTSSGNEIPKIFSRFLIVLCGRSIEISA